MLREIACDESGYEGEKLVGGTTDVFAHASVRLEGGAANECVQELRRRIRSPATEYKANHVLRGKHRATLIWLLGPSGPLYGTARVQLVDKAYFLIGGVVEVLLTDGDAAAFYRAGRRLPDPAPWQAFLAASNTLLRTKHRLEGWSVDAFLYAVDALRGAGLAGDVLDRLRGAGPRAEAYRAGLPDGELPRLDPLLPAILRTAAHWSDGGTPVSIVHDRQNALSASRIAQLTATGRLAGLRLVASYDDARVQMADFLAGVARRLASDQLNGRGDAELTELLRPYVAEDSIWGDPDTWSLLAPTPAAPPPG
ncbi:MAG: hypothetical protein ACRDT4_04045 [Micromonosporaceae bacterium]